MKNKRLIVTAVAVLMAVAWAQGSLVYQSDFTGSDLASAGLASSNGVNGTWILDAANDYAIGQRTGSRPRASLFNTGSWQSGGGFTLNVSFNQIASGDRFSFGIVDASFTPGNKDCLNEGLAGAYGIGFAADGELENLGGDALAFNDGSGTGGDFGGSSILSSGQGNITLNILQTLSITVTATGWSYSLNGAAATFGSFTFDTSRSYRFVAYAQDVDEVYFSNIMLTAIPEPTAAGVLGLAALGSLVLRSFGSFRKDRKNHVNS